MVKMRALALTLAALVAACSTEGPVGPPPAPPAAPPPAPPPPPPSPTTLIQLTSDAGDYIGGGQSYEYTQANAAINLDVSGGHLGLHIDGDQHWVADFVLPSANTSLQPGTYTGLTRYPFNDPVKGGLAWSGEGRGCNTLTGSMTIDTARYVGVTLTA